MLETPTWQANADWDRMLGCGADNPASMNRLAVDPLLDLRDGWTGSAAGVHQRVHRPTRGRLRRHGPAHGRGVRRLPRAADETLAATPADLVTALTMTNVDETVGVTTAAARAGIPPSSPSRSRPTGGCRVRHPTPVMRSRATHAATGSYPAYHMVNCAHPVHLAGAFGGEVDSGLVAFGGFRGGGLHLSAVGAVAVRLPVVRRGRPIWPCSRRVWGVGGRVRPVLRRSREVVVSPSTAGGA